MQTINTFNPRQQMLSADFELFHYKDNFLPTIDFHSHDFYEIYAFIDGSVTYFIEENKYELLPGDVLIIPPGQVHRPLIHVDATSYERIVLWINPSYIALLGKGGVSLIDCFYQISANRNFLYRVSEAPFTEICSVCDRIKNEQQRKDFSSSLMVEACMVEVLVLLCRLFAVDNSAVAVHQPNHIIAKIIAYLNLNYKQKISLDQLAKEFYISKCHLLREFKKYTRCTINDYIMMKRMAHIKQRIAEGASITEASIECGYSDYSNFYKAFTSKFGFSPNEYKQMNKK